MSVDTIVKSEIDDEYSNESDSSSGPVDLSEGALRVFTDHPNTIGVFLPVFKLSVLVVYRPPSYTLVDNLALISYIQSFCKDNETVSPSGFI